MPVQLQTSTAQPGSNSRRRGVVTLEMMFAVPFLVIFVLAVVEFAIIYQVDKQVAYSSRFGAKLASEITRSRFATRNLGNINLSTTPDNLKDRIDDYLETAGLTESCEVRLEHNACVRNPLQVDTDAPCNCGASGTPLPPGEPPAAPNTTLDQAWVKVTVCVPLTGNVPNCLSTFGFDVTGCTFEHSTVFRIETENSAPVPRFRATLAGGTLPGDFAFTGRTLPTDCPPEVPAVVIRGTSPAGGGITVNFDAEAAGFETFDLEDPNSQLTFAWSTTGGVVPSGGSGTTFTGTFTIPPDPDNNPMTTQPDNVRNYTVTLSVTDGCDVTRSCTLPFEIRTADSDP
ncbi:MAG: pilus assembly protein [Planctomycetota bacterium]|nr:MAG: pilus assembly protein [Planctomycetota bacterium]REK29221.1 MAG: pilus assembly protein [Planctomycetota bacterium]REK29405.1 MAG: pilus assembly protein [Planctomycetota bacterium]